MKKKKKNRANHKKRGPFSMNSLIMRWFLHSFVFYRSEIPIKKSTVNSRRSKTTVLLCPVGGWTSVFGSQLCTRMARIPRNESKS